MKRGGINARIWATGGLVVLAGMLAADGQRAAGPARIERSDRAAELADVSVSAGRVVRAIDDPHSGDRWLLMRNDAQPGGPGRLIKLPAQDTRVTEGHGMAAIPAAQRAQLSEPARQRPVIHAGDRLVIEESTAIAEVHLEAVALESATAGARFAVRLKIGGGVVPAIALGPGLAVFAPSATRTEARP